MRPESIPSQAFEQLYRDYHQPIVQYLKRLVNQHETAEDLAHETFVKALRHLEQLVQVSSARSWLYRVATNTAYDYLRRRRLVEMQPLTEAQSQVFAAPSIEARFDDMEPILAALQHLPEHYRRPLLLATAGYDHETIATALNSNVATIKTRVYRARNRFREVYSA
ncbi:MAG TPA: RNA polymerase sigma factor [Roseiflexaceae bacterium]|nr:RNA polymerase sigma factor [Roseiflexaceae bacterium]